MLLLHIHVHKITYAQSTNDNNDNDKKPENAYVHFETNTHTIYVNQFPEHESMPNANAYLLVY